MIYIFIEILKIFCNKDYIMAAFILNYNVHEEMCLSDFIS